MNIDLDLYRHELRVSSDPLVRLSVIDISPERPQRSFVFLHGFGGQALQWRYQLQFFSLQNQVIAPDLRGHGLSDKPLEGYDMPGMVRDLKTLLHLLHVEGPIVLVGHSFGGALATEFALAYPERVSHLILIATAGEFRLNPLFRLGLNLPNWLLRIAGPFTRSWLSAPPRVLKTYYHTNLSRWQGWSKFAQLKVPTLVIHGHRDAVFERVHFDRVAQTIPFAEDLHIGASGHMVMLERRDAVNRAIERFLQGTPHETASWREPRHRDRKPTGRDALKRERPWLAHYDPGIPYTIGLPRIPLHHLLRSAVRRFPNRRALRFHRASLSYRRLNHEANKFANALLGLGIGHGARVVLLLPNLPQMVIAFFGVLKAGAVAVFLPPLTDPEELIRQVRDADPSVLVTLNLSAGLAGQIQTATGLPHIILTDPGDYLPLPQRLISRWRNRGLTLAGSIHWRRLLRSQDRRSPTLSIDPQEPAVIQYTGGTTAIAKGVVLSHRNLVANALQTRHWMPDAQEGRERFLCVLPFSHSYGLTTALNVPICLGATLILKPRFEIHDILKTIQRERPTIFPGVPSMYVAINNARGARKYGISSIKACISGSAPLPIEVQETFEKLTRGKLVEGYGLTEASPVTHANPLNGLRKVGSIGIPLPSTEARIVDLTDGNKTVKPGQIGELLVRGPQVMLGYWRNPEATAQVLTPDGWLRTGDVVQMDADGYFRIIARKADMWYPHLNQKVHRPKPAFPRDVEEVIYEIPQVKEVAVVAIAGHPFAFIIAGNDCPPPESILAYCKRRLPPALVPRLIFFVDDFPRTFIGKVLRRELAKRYEKYLLEDRPA